MTIFIIIITVITSVLAFSNKDISNKLTFNAYLIKEHNEWYRFFSYGFIHADWIHLGVNMYVLYAFGNYVEYKFHEFFGLKAAFYYLVLYLGSIGISVISDYGTQKDNMFYNAVGASGAVSAVVFSFIVFSPLAPMGLLFIPFHLPAVFFGAIYLIYSMFMAKKEIDNIGHNAHFGGAIFGVVFTIALKPRLFLLFIAQIISLFH